MFCIAVSFDLAACSEAENVNAVGLVKLLHEFVLQILRDITQDPFAVFDLKQRILQAVSEPGKIFGEFRPLFVV